MCIIYFSLNRGKEITHADKVIPLKFPLLISNSRYEIFFPVSINRWRYVTARPIHLQFIPAHINQTESRDCIMWHYISPLCNVRNARFERPECKFFLVLELSLSSDYTTTVRKHKIFYGA